MDLIVSVGSVIGFGMGLWVLLDGNRLAKHVAIAERLMADGMSEADAMEQSGCNFWDRPWYERITTPYPYLQSER